MGRSRPKSSRPDCRALHLGIFEFVADCSEAAVTRIPSPSLEGDLALTLPAYSLTYPLDGGSAMLSTSVLVDGVSVDGANLKDTFGGKLASNFALPPALVLPTPRSVDLGSSSSIRPSYAEKLMGDHFLPHPLLLINQTLKLLHVINAKIRAISLIDAKFFHMIIGQSQGVTILGVRISAPGDSPNTDGIHIGDSSDVRISRSHISSGDDCISIGPGSSNVTVSGVQCGPGHGISVGSLGKLREDKGVNGIRVLNCTLAGTDNGVRIKTWRDSPPIMATNMLFSDIVMKEVRNPIIIDQEYCPGSCDEDKPASRVKINNVRFQNIRGTSATDVAINLVCSSSTPCDHITLENVDLRPLPPTPGLAPTVPLTSCLNVGIANTVGFVFPPACF